ncbi:hypothetical protein [Pseudobacteroides cellulosolvens]|uniref:hypothetical protein n=1 Tax=Pseudobacteroides cellulosolvens TaxID=35825 RepID=UPI0012B5CBCF|nr:hypothetical protein [Pseudobacteroides cellulosolvens]
MSGSIIEYINITMNATPKPTVRTPPLLELFCPNESIIISIIVDSSKFARIIEAPII